MSACALQLLACLLDKLPLVDHHLRDALKGMLLYFSVFVRHELHCDPLRSKSLGNVLAIRVEAHELAQIEKGHGHCLGLVRFQQIDQQPAATRSSVRSGAKQKHKQTLLHAIGRLPDKLKILLLKRHEVVLPKLVRVQEPPVQCSRS